jgi:predicted nucleotidyltransferase
MPNTYKIFLNRITDEVVIELLRVILPVLEAAGVDYFVVGAFARDAELLAKGHTDPPVRKTRDLDLAVMVGSIETYDALKMALAQLPGLEESQSEPYKFIFRQAYEVDLLPFGAIADEKGQVELKARQAFILELPGIEEVYPFAETIETQEGLQLKVASLPGVILLKLIAWNDRPERQKDIRDIDHILNNFMTLHWDEISAEPDNLFELYGDETIVYEQCVSARYIGRQMGLMLQGNAQLRKRILELLRENMKSSSMAQLMSPQNVEDSQRIIKAMLDGMNDSIAK